MSEITNEMKAKCMGEFKLSYEDICPKCVLGDDSPCMCNSDQNGVFTNTRAVPWDLCKQIFKTMYALSPAAAENAALKEENERLKEAARLQKLNNENAYQEIDLVQMENRTLKARVAVLEKAVTAVDELICHSSGVSGLHLNGEMAPWGDLLEGGHYESWLIDFSAALKEPANEG